MFDFFSRFVRRLPVGRKLMLIYLLDLTAVLYVSGILIHEKITTIDFTRKEIVGNRYVQAVRSTLQDLPAIQADPMAASRELETIKIKTLAQQLRVAEQAYGAEMQSAELSARLIKSLLALENPQTALTPGLIEVVDDARNLLTRIGNQSNLILDPDLDSYYTMSLVLLRFIEVEDLLLQITDKSLILAQRAGSPSPSLQTNLLILQGRFDAAIKGTEADYREALAATTPQVRAVLNRSSEDLIAQLKAFDELVQAFGKLPPEAILDLSKKTQTQLHSSWKVGVEQLDVLLQARVDMQIRRMVLHLGTALALLGLILALVYFVARQISHPVKQLAKVADDVSRSGDYTRRAWHDSPDEIGHLVTAFNTMLSELDLNRSVREELAATERAYDAQRALLASFPSPLMVTSVPEHKILHANDPAKPWLGATNTDPWLHCLDSPTRARYFQLLSDMGSVDGFEVSWKIGSDAMGQDRMQWALLSGRRMTYEGQNALLTVFTPIEKIKRLERRLQLWAKVFEASSEGILILDVSRRVVIANQSFMRTGGWELTEISGQEPDFFYSDHHNAAFYDTLWQSTIIRGVWQGEVWVRRKSGEQYPTWLVANAVRNAEGHITHLIVSASDMTEHKKSEARIHHLAHHDVLTDLPNRSLCLERLRMAIEQASRQNQLVGVVFIDLDRFKNINDSMGHHVGDALLCSVAKRLQSAVRGGDTVSRLGGDEFVIVIAGATSAHEIYTVVAERMVPLIRETHEIEGSTLNVSCSAGIAIYPQDGRDVDLLMRNADSAMYQAKAAGRNHAVFFKPEFLAQAQERLELEQALTAGIANQELRLYYQPRIDAASGRVCGVEALVRWQHPQQGLMSPARFIPIAEDSGLINTLGAWVLAEGCRQHRAWFEGEEGFLPISINVSVKQLQDDTLADQIKSLISEHQIDAGAIELELTETFLMESAMATIDALGKLKALGLSLSVDDFGTGYSSLNYLNQFPIDKLKIDQSFVRDMMTDQSDLVITRAIIALGHTLGLKLVAEGVETIDQADELRRSGCDELQGFFYAKPMPAAELRLWLRAHRSHDIPLLSVTES
jgi:diguanylate cyclase (GGDEF)-like protein/PAS domain S-box-containing protein